MKSKKIKKALSITIASAVIASSVPAGALVVSAEDQNHEENETVTTTAETPKEETSAETPKEETSAETPKEESTAETPKEEVPAETPKEESPTETPKEEVPTETPKEETPTETPTETLKEETPTETPKKESPAKAPTPTATPAAKVTPAVIEKVAQVIWSVPDGTESEWDGTAHPVFAVPKNPMVRLSYDIQGPNGSTTEIKEPGDYTITVTASILNKKIKVSNPTITYHIKKAQIRTFFWENLEVEYTGEKVALPTAKFVNADRTTQWAEPLLNAKVVYTDGSTEKTDAGEYEVSASLGDDAFLNAHYEIATETNAIQKIGKKGDESKKDIEIVWEGPDQFVYNGSDQGPTCTAKNYSGAIKVTYFKDGVETESHADAGTYIAVAECEDPDCTISEETKTKTFTISKCDIIVKADPVQKVYGANTVLTYSVTANDEKLAEEAKGLLDNIEGGILTTGDQDVRNVGDYKIYLREGIVLDNFEINYESAVLTVIPLQVRIVPDGNQCKTYGEYDPDLVYSIEYNADETALSGEKIFEELGDVLIREEGELPGNGYSYGIREVIGDEDPILNYELTIDDATFTIYPVEITEIQDINSRQNSVKVTTDMSEDRRDYDISTNLKITATFPDSKEIAFSHNIGDYIHSAENAISFDGLSVNLSINEAAYTKKGNEAIKWIGRLPAGTELWFSVEDDEGNIVSDASYGKTVGKVAVTLNQWSGVTQNAEGKYYVLANGGKAASLILSGSRPEELVEILYNKGNGGTEVSYAKMDTSFPPVVNNSGSTHVTQSVTANIVDTLNLECNSVSQSFYVDDQAFPIESSAIQFENRGKEIKIRLPEAGTVTNVSIPGATVETSGAQGQEVSLKVNWSGKNLIPTGTAISVTYKDLAGHEGTGTGTAARSTVSTPITFRIRPELNVNGYLNGQSNTLIVSGAACSCEPIRVTAAGISQTVNATQVDTWTDSNGSWEVMFDMNSLPEKQDFVISAEYTDVNGTPYSINAKYESFVSPADIVSPIYEAMTHISGMVEPGTAVALVVNGDTKKYQEIEVDRFGRLSMDDVPMMFGGEDSFDIYVQDIAGNVSISHYEIPEAKDPSEVTAVVNPLGKYIFKGDKDKASSYVATPISGKAFTDKKDTLELPLIMGMSYEVGTLAVKKSGNGIVVSSSIDADGLDEEDYKIENEHLYVYSTKPSAEDLENQTGKEYTYGEEIPLGANDTIWIVDNKNMTVLTDSIEDLKLFNYKESKEYETYQEQ